MNDQAITHLVTLCQQYPELRQLPRRCRSALADRCPNLEAERMVLGSLHDLGLPELILQAQHESSLLPLPHRLARIARASAQRSGLRDEWMLWGVYGWGAALDLDVALHDALAPSIVSFQAEVEGGNVLLTWDVMGENAELHLDPVGSVTGQSRLRYRPKDSKTVFTLRARNSAGDQSASVTVTLPAAQIARFTLEPPVLVPGSTARLSWETLHATSVNLDGVGDVTGSSEHVFVAPRAQTTYTLRARGAGGQEATETLTAPVVQIHEFKAVQQKISPHGRRQDSPCILQWRTENAKRVEIVGFGTVEANGSIGLKEREKDTQMTLRAYAGDGTFVSESVKLKAVKIRTFECDTPVAIDGAEVLVRWRVNGARKLELSGVGDVTGLRQAQVVVTQRRPTVRLTATGDTGLQTRELSVHVLPVASSPRIPVGIARLPYPALEHLSTLPLGPLPKALGGAFLLANQRLTKPLPFHIALGRNSQKLLRMARQNVQQTIRKTRIVVRRNARRLRQMPRVLFSTPKP